MKNNYFLPYDYSRCQGKKDSVVCEDCLRRLAPCWEEWQSWIAGVPEEDGMCAFKISVEAWEKSV